MWNIHRKNTFYPCKFLYNTSEGVIKIRTIRGKAGDELRWDKTLFSQIRGLPWEPIPGRDSIDVPINVAIPDEDKVVIPAAENTEKVMVRRVFKIFRTDVAEYGLTPGCKGCLAADAGHPVAKNHSAECRSRMLTEISNKNPNRIARLGEKYFEELNTELQPSPMAATEVAMEEELNEEMVDENMDLGTAAQAH